MAVVFFSMVDATLGATVRDATRGAAAVFDAVVVLGLAANFDAAVVVVVAFLIGANLPLISGFFESVGLDLDEVAVLAAMTAVVAATATAAMAASLTTLSFSTTGGSGSGTGADADSINCATSASGVCSFGISGADGNSGSICGSSVGIIGCSNCCTISFARYGSGSEKSNDIASFVSETGATDTFSLASAEKFITSSNKKKSFVLQFYLACFKKIMSNLMFMNIYTLPGEASIISDWLT